MSRCAPRLGALALSAVLVACSPGIDAPGDADKAGGGETGDSGATDPGGDTGAEDTGAQDTAAPDPDADADGFPASEDCDDTDATVNPNAIEVCADGVDNDCDGLRSCVDVEVWVVAGGTSAGTGSWALRHPPQAVPPTPTADAELVVALTCVAGAPLTFGCEAGTVHDFTLEWAAGHMVWPDGTTVPVSAWDGTLYQSEAEGEFTYGETRFAYRQRVDFDATEVEDVAGMRPRR